jgi:hypothetical protein
MFFQQREAHLNRAGQRKKDYLFKTVDIFCF